MELELSGIFHSQSKVSSISEVGLSGLQRVPSVSRVNLVPVFCLCPVAQFSILNSHASQGVPAASRVDLLFCIILPSSTHSCFSDLLDRPEY